MDLAEDMMKWTVPFQLQWVEALGVLSRFRQFSPGLQQHLRCKGVSGLQPRGKGRRLPEVVVQIRKFRCSGTADDSNTEDSVASAVTTTTADTTEINEENFPQRLAAQISGPRSYQWILDGVPLRDANTAAISLSEAYELPCTLQLRTVNEDGTPRDNLVTGRLPSMSVSQMARTVLSMTAGLPRNSTMAAGTSASRLFVKPSPGLTCVVWTASGAQYKA